MRTVIFGSCCHRVNALAKMYARAKEIGNEDQKHKSYNDLVIFCYYAARLYAEQFNTITASERDRVSDEVVDRLLKMIDWFEPRKKVPFSGFVAWEFRNHPNCPSRRRLDEITTELILVNSQTNEEYTTAEAATGITPRQTAEISQILEQIKQIKHWLGEDDASDEWILEKWGVIYPEHEPIGTNPMRFRASLLAGRQSVQHWNEHATMEFSDNAYSRDPYAKRRLWI